MTRRPFFILTLAFLLLPPLARADAPPMPTSPPTLAQALAAAPPPKDDVYLAVAADKVLLPQDAVPPQKDDPASQVAQSYGRIIREFGGVMAVAPPTMTVLNTEPGTPNPYDGMPPGDALRLLLACLSDAQWKTLTGTSGLGLSDLVGTTQQALFGALFPALPLTLHPRDELLEEGAAERALPKLMPEDVTQAHLRLGQRVTLAIPAETNGGGAVNTVVEAPSGATGGVVRYELPHGAERRGGRQDLYGVTVRATIPNAPKASGLDYDAPALRVPVGVAGVKTVDALVARIGGAVGMEIYADPRYEKRSVTLIGPASARAADLLRALALCVAGTYRRVGPAYVLTDDLTGLGTRRTILARWAQDADAARQGALDEAADRMIATRDLDGLPPLDSGLAFSDAQKAEKAEAAKDPSHIQGGAFVMNVPFAQLTPPQQALARRTADKWNAAPPPSFQNDRLTLDRPLELRTQPTLTLETPAVPGAVLLDRYFGAFQDLFRASDKMRRQQEEKGQAPAPPPALGSLMSRQPRRAVLARPRTAKEVDALVAAMKGVGLNTLWLDVFSGGKSHIDTDPDILTEASKQTKDTGITVLPVLDLLRWGGDAPEDARDRTILDETSAQAEAYQDRFRAVMYQGKTAEEAAKLPPPPGLSVCPAAPSVQGPLLALVRRLAVTEGAAGIVLRDAVPPGYDHPDGGREDERAEPLGYAPGLRLAFLRRAHADPVDLADGPGRFFGPDTRLPDFDDSRVTEPVQKEWGGFRAGAAQDLLQKLDAAARPAPPRKPAFWIEQRSLPRHQSWVGLWGRPLATLPTLFQTLTDRRFDAEQGTAASVHAQCRTNLYELPAEAAASKDALARALQNLPPGWDGFVLDLSDDAGSSALDGLAKSLTPPKPEAAKIPQK